ncbi:N-acetyltransferase [Natrarchaeobius halalkaliphilus]|uniref:N-acetyltransferase n=1 Tax=Natrarchaeobius halalkaliphilus TaxID=1679091 RepID=A0A3N6M275_9EURY|nr:GNAT family N-acetyltransferase [Natrarchaeobius halalkaliphilus]RQG89900.1 N-acetyltransferase [Natrarchaeobius halalkaliphilus]
MEYELLGWPPDGPTLRLDYERFSYAGKFVMSNTGKAVARTEDDEASERLDLNGDTDGERDHDVGRIVAAAAFNEDRTDDETLWIRYVTVDRAHRGDGIGPKLLSLVRERALKRGYDRLRIAVNNPFAYEALYRTGFVYTGETTGIAELLLEYPSPLELDERSGDGVADSQSRHKDVRFERYQAGLEEFRERDLSEAEERFLEDRRERTPPNPRASR